MSKVFIGTSGFNYRHWRERFYSADLRQKDWLSFYASQFKTVELNVTFYNLPSEAAFKHWKEVVPKDFCFSLKGSRTITHYKKLIDFEDSLELFLSRVNILEQKAGIILWQFPASFKVNLERLENFCKLLSKKTKCRQTFEFRSDTWFTEGVYKILRKYNFSLCIADSPRWPMATEITADYVYIRLHGSKRLYGSKYTKKEIEDWAAKIKGWLSERKDVYVYFDNDSQAFAVKNAAELIFSINLDV